MMLLSKKYSPVQLLIAFWISLLCLFHANSFAIKDYFGGTRVRAPVACSNYLNETKSHEELGWTSNGQPVFLGFAAHGISQYLANSLVRLSAGEASKTLSEDILKALEDQKLEEIRASKDSLENLLAQKAIAWVGVEQYDGQMGILSATLTYEKLQHQMIEMGLRPKQIEDFFLVLLGAPFYLRVVNPHLFEGVDFVYLEDEELNRSLDQLESISFQKFAQFVDQRDQYAAQVIFSQKRPGAIVYGKGHEPGIRKYLAKLHSEKK